MKRFAIVLGAAVVLMGAWAWPAGANNAWGGYHWAQAGPSPTVTVPVDGHVSVDGNWMSIFNTTVGWWNVPSTSTSPTITGSPPDVVNLQAALAAWSKPKRCNAVAGRIEVCNNSYGNNGWLGVATVWLSGSHIVQATVKVNDFYFNNPAYGYTPDTKLHVMCQEIGHTLGLDHQFGYNGNDAVPSYSCMDYAGKTDANYNAPNDHDYAELQAIYTSHTDGSSSSSAAPATGRGHGGGIDSIVRYIIRVHGAGSLRNGR